MPKHTPESNARGHVDTTRPLGPVPERQLPIGAALEALIAAAPEDDPKADHSQMDNGVMLHAPSPEEIRQALAVKRAARQRGTQKAPTKVPVTMRLDARVVEHWKRSGPGWQSRLNKQLLELLPAATTRRTS